MKTTIIKFAYIRFPKRNADLATNLRQGVTRKVFEKRNHKNLRKNFQFYRQVQEYSESFEQFFLVSEAKITGFVTPCRKLVASFFLGIRGGISTI